MQIALALAISRTRRAEHDRVLLESAAASHPNRVAHAVRALEEVKEIAPTLLVARRALAQRQRLALDPRAVVDAVAQLG